MRMHRLSLLLTTIILLLSAHAGRAQDCNHACEPAARDASGCCPAAPVSKPRPRTVHASAPASSYLLLTPDADCEVSVDGMDQAGTLRKDEVRKVKVGVGDHVVKALAVRATTPGEFKSIVTISAPGEQKAVAISFAGEIAHAADAADATLMLLTDADCEVSVDEVSVGIVSPDSVKKVPVKIEDHLIVAKSPDGRIIRSFVKVDHAGQVAVNIACANSPPPSSAPAAPDESAIESYVLTAEDRYSISLTVNPVMPVSGIDRGFYNANLFRQMYVGVMKDQVTSSLIKQGFSVADSSADCHKTGGLFSQKVECVNRPAAQATPPDCQLNIAFVIDDGKTTLRVDSVLDCAGYPAERFTHSKDIEGRVPMWISPSKNKNFAESFLFPTAEDLAKKIGETRVLKQLVLRKKAH